jgi:WD40 repeat protein
MKAWLRAWWLLSLLMCGSVEAVVRANFPLHKVYVGSVPPFEEVMQLEVDPAERYLVVRRNREAHVWDAADGLYLGHFVDDDAHTDITASHLTAGGVLWLGTSNGQVSAWDLGTLQRKQLLQTGSERVIHLLVDGLGEQVYAYTPGTLHAFIAASGKRMFQAILGDGGCRQLGEAVKGSLLCVTMEGRLQLVRTSDGKAKDVPTADMLGQDIQVRMLASSNDYGTHIYLGGDKCAYHFSWTADRRTLVKINLECGHITAVSVSPDGNWVVVATTDGKVNLMGLAASKERVVDTGKAPVSSMVWSVDSRHLYFAIDGNSKRALQQANYRVAVDDESPANVYTGSAQQFINDAAVSGSHLVTCLNTGQLMFWHLSDLNIDRRAIQMRAGCITVAGLPSGAWLLAGDAKGRVSLIDAQTVSVTSEVELSGSTIRGLGLFDQGGGAITGFVATSDGRIKSLTVVNRLLVLGPEIHRVTGPFQAVSLDNNKILVTTMSGFETIDLQGKPLGGQTFRLPSTEPGIAVLSSATVFVPSLETDQFHIYTRTQNAWKRVQVAGGGYIAGALLADGVFVGGTINGKVLALRTSTGDVLDEFQPGLGTISRLLVDTARQHVIVIGTGGSFVVWDRPRHRWIAQAWIWSQDETAVATSDGYFKFTGQRPLTEMLLRTQRSANKVLPVKAFFDVFHRPDLVRATLMGDDEYVKRASQELTIEKALKSPPPSIGTVSAPKADIATERIRIPYTIKSEGGGVGEVLVLHNGKLIKSDGFYKDAPGSTMVAMNTTKASSAGEVAKGVQKMLGSGESTSAASNRDSVVVRQAKPKTLNAAGEYSDSVEIDVIPGEDNEITVMARNQDNTILGQGQTVRFKSSLPKADPHLWILPVGIASFQDSGVRKLASPKKDALDFACSYGGKEALKSAGISCDKPGYANSLFKSANIHVIDPLTNEKATRSNILAKLDEIATKAKPTDTFIWFVSSHGTMDANSVYGIVPFDAKCQDPKCDAASGLVSSNDILEKSKSIKAMKQLLILDTCQAGGLDNKMSGLYDARMSGLAKNMGLHLYAAATATESALDGQDASKNSIFTATLLEGLAGASAKNTEGQISIIPLGQYVKTKTPEASRKAYADMTPQTPVIQHFGKDAPLTGVAGR